MSAFIDVGHLKHGEPINEQPRSIKDPVLNRIQPNPAPDDTQCADCCVCCISFCGQVCSSLWHWLLCFDLCQLCSDQNCWEHCCHADCCHCCMSCCAESWT